MNWSSDTASYTNLFVGSEIGPFAASLRKKVSDPSYNTMLVFPLTISALQIDRQLRLLSRCPAGWGRLFTSQLRDGQPIFNLDVGDMVHLLPMLGSPRIRGKILRAAFPLKQPPKVILPISLPPRYAIYVGGYFTLNACTIIDPQILRACFAKRGLLKKTASLVLAPHPKNEHDLWDLFIPQSHPIGSLSDSAQHCFQDTILTELPDIPVSIHLLSTDPISPATPRQTRVHQVRRGEAPKGVLKRWPLYVIQADLG